MTTSGLTRSGMFLAFKMHVDMRRPSVRMRVNVHVQQPHTQNDDHDRHCQFEDAGGSFGNDDSGAQNKNPGDEKGTRMSDTPQRSRRSGLSERPPFAHDG